VKNTADIDISSIFNSPWGKTHGIADFASTILFNAVALAGLILLFLFVFGGISLIIGAGQSNPETAAKGKTAITSALIGFLIIFAAYWIIQIVQAVTGLNILSPNP
jgi:hypothetical protein